MDSLARSLARRAVRFYYPHIEVEFRERLPREGATLFVANHPNSVMDAPLIGLVAERPVHFFAKAPLFDLPFLGGVLRELGMVPAYRGADDKSQVRRNLQTLDAGADWLCRGEAVGIFPEGKSHDKEAVEQIRSGAARIAWQAVKEGAAVHVVPLGLNYERKERFRSAVWVRVGEPIDAAAYFREHPEERKAVRTLTEEIDRALRSIVVHLDEPAWEPILSEVEALLDEEPEEILGPVAIIEHRKRLANGMNYFLAVDRSGSEAVAAAMRRHHEDVTSAGLTLDSPILRLGAAPLAWQLLRRTLWGIVGLVPAIAGTVHHLVPFALTRALARLVTWQGRTTVAQSRLLIGLPVYALWYAVVWFLVSRTSVRVAWIWIAAAPLAGLVALQYWGRLRRVFRDWWHELKMLFRPRELRRLRRDRVELRHKLLQLRQEYRATVEPR